jgi:hypothetical protein
MESKIQNPKSKIRWTSWPLRDEPRRKTALLFGFVLLTVAISTLTGLVYGVLAVVLLFIALGPYLLPSRIEVSETGVKKFFFLFNRNRPWSVYKRFVAQKDGVFLGTFPHPSRLDSFRGDFLRFTPATDREAVMTLVRANIPDQDAAV